MRSTLEYCHAFEIFSSFSDATKYADSQMVVYIDQTSKTAFVSLRNI